MADGWLRVCRALAPAAWRERVFDPAAADLAHACAIAVNGDARPPRLAIARLAARQFALALTCRWMHWTGPLRRQPRPSGGEDLMAFWVHTLAQAARRLAREPMFSLVAVMTLALGIGANAAVFGFLNAYLLVPLAAPDARGLVRVYGQTAERPFDPISYPDYLDLRDGQAAMDLAVHVGARVLVGADASGEARSAELVSGNYFRALRLTPLRGRLLDSGDDGVEGAHPVVVISERLWRLREGAADDIVGRTIRLNGTPFDIVGVAGSGFRGALGTAVTDLWAPISMQRVLRPRGTNTLDNRGWGFLRALGRLSSGTPIALAQQALDRVAASLDRRFPSSEKTAYVVAPALVLEETDRRALTPFVSMTAAFTGLLMIVTCANLAGVMQARAQGRRREVAIRQSLGAGRWRLIGERFAESGVLVIAGGAAALVVARGVLVGLAAWAPPAQLTGAIDLQVPFDARVVSFVLAVCALAAVVLGVPAVWSTSRDGLASLKDDAITTTGGRRGSRGRRMSVAVQVAVSATLLVACGLLMASLRNLRTYSPGFDTTNLALVSVDLNRAALPKDRTPEFRRDSVRRVRQLPGVIAADVATSLPLAPGRDRTGIRVPGFVPQGGASSIAIDDNVVGAGYFAAMGLRFAAGAPWDADGSDHGLVVNETMARTFWPGQSAIGRPVELVGEGSLTVTGVVHDSAYYQLGEHALPFMYLPAEAENPRTFTLIARTAPAARAMLPDMARAIASADPGVSPYDATTFEESQEVPLYPRRLLMTTAGTLGGLALLISGIGLYGVVSGAVGQRTKEIGVRMALGARPGDVQAGVMRDSLLLAAAGAMAGLIGAGALAGALQAWLFGVSAIDLRVYAGVSLLLAVVAAAAAWGPARRAARVDPIVALRT